jgi:16S rRNA (guanine966-N2)-methyltransferase
MPDAGRVVTGTAKGMRLAAPGAGTRPLSDRVKQALFGMLEAEGALDEEGAFLDLFAGSGAAGIEALSRGVGRAVFVEHDARAAAVVDGNLRRSGLAGGRVVRRDVLRFLDSETSAAGAPFGAVLVDPPYGEPLLEPVLQRLGETRRGWVRQDGVVVVKHFWRDAPPPRSHELELYRQRRFGETMLSFYRFAAPTPATPDGELMTTAEGS